MCEKCIDWVISNQAPNRGRLNDYPVNGVGSQAVGESKWWAPYMKVKI